MTFLFTFIGTNYWRNRVIKVARDYENRVMNFAIAAKSDFSRQISDLGFTSENPDDIHVAITSDDGSRYKMTEKFRYDILLTT